MKFKLSDSFVSKYKTIKPPFGFNGLGELVYLRTYSRIKENGQNEQWYETVQRVVEGTFNLQKNHIEKYNLGWNNKKAHHSAQEMFDRIFNMKFLPPGRGLWAMGSSITEDKKLFAALNNCGFVTTENIKDDLSNPFCFLMDASMLGVGVGFDTKGAGKIFVKGASNKHSINFIVPDTREGWVESIKLLIDSYFTGSPEVTFDYSLVRLEGVPIKGFGGLSSGPEPLKEAHERIRNSLDKNTGSELTITTIVDIMNMIGAAVVAGNVRRTAEIVFGDYKSEEYLKLKDYRWNSEKEVYEGSQKERADWGWTSNNSIFADLGMDYTKVAEQTGKNGEPGYAWLENMKAYSRMDGEQDNKDRRIMGGNPCQPAWAKLLTKNGIRELKNIKIGDEIWSERGWTKVLNKWSTGIKEVYKYQTTAGTFYGTKNHKIISQGVKIEAEFAESIDRLNGFYDTSLKINPQDVMDGLVLGDGTVHKASGDLIGLLIGRDDYDYIKSEVKDLIKDFRPGITDTFYEIVTTITSEELCKTYERNIPTRFLQNPENLVGLLRGLYSANGSICGNRITYKTASPLMRESIQLALSSLGINSYFTTNKPSLIKFSNGEYLCKESYDINITSDRSKFINLIGFIQKYKNNKLNNLLTLNNQHGKTTFDIIEVTQISKEQVFDITVDNETHTYWTQGLNVSNCLEQSLESYELCCLVETFPHNHKSLEDFLITLKYAYLYAKTVTLGQTHWPETNRVMLRNRRIGCSMSGIAQFVTNRGIHELKKWCEEGYKSIEKYDEIYSDWLAIPKSIKKTSIKPSGTVSLVAGATPGVHFPESVYYIRRMRLGINSDLVGPLETAGYKIEPCVGSETTTLVVEIPVCVDENIKTIDDLTIWEQLSLAAFMQKYWADNQVSCTVTFKESERNQIKPALDYYQYQLKGISFLPKTTKKAYAQMPYEQITREQYEETLTKLKPVKFKKINNEAADVEKFCTNDVCMLK